MRIAVAVLLVFVTAATSAEMISVVPLTPEGQPRFNCGDRCKFRGAVPKEPLRLRIIRGTKTGLKAIANDPKYQSAGCIELYSTIVRPRRSRRTAALLDLNFYFSATWLGSNGANGQYVFIVERDPVSNGPELERTSMLRLPSGAQGAQYFSAGIDVTVLPPVHATPPSRSRATLRDVVHLAAAGEAETAMEITIAPAPAPPGMLLPDARPHPAPIANCVDLRFDQQPVVFRRADAGSDNPPARAPRRSSPTATAARR